MTRVLLVRHGQSEWNADGRWQGQADPPLTDLGRAQALHATRALGQVDAIVSSDLQRAAETAEIISEALGIGPVARMPGLRERSAGEWEGLTRAEIERDWPGYLEPPPPVQGSAEALGPAAQAARNGGMGRRPPGWESDESVVARALGALAVVHELTPDGDVLVVTHGGLVYAIERLLGAGFVRLPNLGGRWLEVGPEGPTALGDRVVLVDPDELTVPEQI
ncbi:MAG: histidine phosphatase family protein [Microthrixaceae bacterium]